MHQDDPADAVLFQFKQRTERKLERLDERLSRAEESLDAAEQQSARLREEIGGLRGDIARTQRILLEVQVEIRGSVKQLMNRLDALGGSPPAAEHTDG